MPKLSCAEIEHAGDAVETRDSIADIWGPRTPHSPNTKTWSTRVDVHTSTTPDRWVQSACVMCSNGCGMDIGVKDGKIVGVRGREVDRINKGRLGPKGMHSWITNHSEDRLKYPQIRNEKGELRRATWDEAMDLIVRKTKETLEKLTTHGIGIYTSGQLFLEEYYTLATIGKAGLHNLHMDGNTRLCTATAAASMRESFGSDGQPGCYEDIDHCDTLMMVGHNMSETQTVLWSRVLDRLESADPPKLIVIDPRRSPPADRATVHLAPRIGTNLALLNGLLYLLFRDGNVDEEFIERCTVGIGELREVCGGYTPEKVEEITGVSVERLEEAGKVLGGAKKLVCTALQGVYQSNQATSSACAINNIVLVRGMIGKEGATVLQFNGQPTAQNNRETGCNGEYPAFRNPQNPAHMEDLARHWNIDVDKVPHWNLPTHIMQMLDYIDKDLMTFFWVSGSNPAVSLPDLMRAKKLLSKKGLFLVAQDIFPNETTEMADVVLPAAMWGEKTGCFTNVDRTVHISHKAIEPPGEAKSDLEIFVDYATRMDFRDKDGKPLVHWTDSKGAFQAWKSSTEGRPCDYTGLSHEKLTGGSGIQWPCNEETSPNGSLRLFTDGRFPTDWTHCESYGHDHDTGAPLTPDQYREMNPNGRAILKTTHYRPSEEMPNPEYPFGLSTGRRVYHFHTRTKTARTKKLHEAAPEAWIQVNEEDARELGISDGDLVRVESRHGEIQIPAHLGKIERGSIFVPFHYGTYGAGGRETAANILTIASWDPISKQPLFKAGAVKLTKIADAADAAQYDIDILKEKSKSTEQQAAVSAEESHGEAAMSQDAIDMTDRKSHVGDFLGVCVGTAKTTVRVLSELSESFKADGEIRGGTKILKEFMHACIEELSPFVEKYADESTRALSVAEPLRDALFPPRNEKQGPFDMILDLQSLAIVLNSCASLLNALLPTASALIDVPFRDAVSSCQKRVQRMEQWVQNQIKVKAPQALIVPARRSAVDLHQVGESALEDQRQLEQWDKPAPSGEGEGQSGSGSGSGSWNVKENVLDPLAKTVQNLSGM